LGRILGGHKTRGRRVRDHISRGRKARGRRWLGRISGGRRARGRRARGHEAMLCKAKLLFINCAF
jgi:hypothetical protein